MPITVAEVGETERLSPASPRGGGGRSSVVPAKWGEFFSGVGEVMNGAIAPHPAGVAGVGDGQGSDGGHGATSSGSSSHSCASSVVAAASSVPGSGGGGFPVLCGSGGGGSMLLGCGGRSSKSRSGRSSGGSGALPDFSFPTRATNSGVARSETHEARAGELSENSRLSGSDEHPDTVDAVREAGRLSAASGSFGFAGGLLGRA